MFINSRNKLTNCDVEGNGNKVTVENEKAETVLGDPVKVNVFFVFGALRDVFIFI